MTDDPATEPAGAAVRWALREATGHVVRGDDAGLAFPIGKKPVVIGAAADCDVRLNDASVSKRHVAVQLQGASVHLKDLGSRNGTYVGAQKVVESLVPIGTIVQIGRTFVHLRGDDASVVIEPSAADSFGDLAGQSVAMRQLYAVLERVAPTEATVFLDGETGTGKELAARAIHARSGRKGPLVVFDGSAVAPELVESQLFGHVKGAFTGAVADRAGVFEAARGGTVFLDEIDSLPLDLQPKLLRALESKRVVRVGDTAERPVDVRVVAASGRSPEDLAMEGALRKDLYFRLAVVRVTMPSLRDRLDDVPILAARILDRMGKTVIVEDGPALERLRAYAWPGNVRELRNVLERAVALAPRSASRLDDLPLQLGGRAEAAPVAEIDLDLPYKEAKERVVLRWEREYLRGVFEKHGRNVSKTAREIGLSRLHLRTLLQRHGLTGEDEGEPG
jgi:DNA-binding NtrC family response regulator